MELKLFFYLGRFPFGPGCSLQSFVKNKRIFSAIPNAKALRKFSENKKAVTLLQRLLLSFKSVYNPNKMA